MKKGLHSVTSGNRTIGVGADSGAPTPEKADENVHRHMRNLLHSHLVP